MDFDQLAGKICDMLEEYDLELGGRFSDIEYILKAAVKLGVLDVEVKDNIFDLDLEGENT